MSRFNKQRQYDLEGKRTVYAIGEITKLGFTVTGDSSRLTFLFKDQTVFFYPYSGWHTGKTIKDGRGLKKLLEQLVDKPE